MILQVNHQLRLSGNNKKSLETFIYKGSRFFFPCPANNLQTIVLLNVIIK